MLVKNTVISKENIINMVDIFEIILASVLITPKNCKEKIKKRRYFPFEIKTNIPSLLN